MTMRTLINLVESKLTETENDLEWLYWFWFNPATGQLIHVEGTHTNIAVFELGYWPEGRDPAEKDDLDLEDDEILRMATSDGWVRGRYGKRDEGQVGWNARYDMDDNDRTDMELSLQGLQANVVKAVRHFRRKKVDFDILYVDFDGGHQMEGHRLAGNRLEMFLKTGAIPSDKVMEDTSAAPDILYHHSETRNRKSIAQTGLTLSHSETAQEADEDEEGAGAIFFAERPLSQQGIDIWEVDVRGLPLHPDNTTDWPEGEVWWMTYQDIPPARLKLL